MPTTNSTAAKLAVIDALREEAAAGLLAGVQVHYAVPPRIEGLKTIYGGGWRFEQLQEVPEQAGLLVQEITSVSLYVRVVARPPVGVEVTDAACDEIGNLIGQVFAARPRLAGGMTWLGIASGQGDYGQTDLETISIHAYQVQVGSRFSWGD